MTTKKTLFISDVHLGPGKPWDWFDPKAEGDHLIEFLEYVQRRTKQDGDIKELVILGDFFDLWVCPHDEIPHTFDDILTANKRVIDTIKSIADDVHICYANGNHDFRVSGDDIARAFDGKVEHIGDVYRRGNIHAEHGHRYAMFNCPDANSGDPERLPLGYFITRLHTTLGQARKTRYLMALEAMDELIQALGEEKLAQSILDVVHDAAERGSKKEIDAFEMGRGKRNPSYESIRERYKNLYSDWKTKSGHWGAIQAVMCEMDRLGPIADSLCRNGVRIVVFGHSHGTKVDKDHWFTRSRIYANSGYWCGLGKEGSKQDNAHFVEANHTTVRLCAFEDGEAVVKQEERL